VQLFPTNRKLQITLLVLCAAIIVFAYKTPEPPATPEKENLFATTGADYYMKHYRIVSSNSEGKAEAWIEGKELSHFPNMTTQLIQPYITVKDKQEETWTSKAVNGLITNGNEIKLDGGVQIEQVNKQITLKTKSLVISLDDRIANSDDHVELTTKTGKMTATGLHFDFDNRKINLLSNVRAIYVEP